MSEENDQSSTAHSSHTAPRRVPLHERTPLPDTSTPTLGGVTATPHTTGSLPKITVPLRSDTTESVSSQHSDSSSANPPRLNRFPQFSTQSHPLAYFQGWVPDLASMWSQLLIPFACGIVLSRFQWVHLLLLASWLMGYTTLFSLDIWLRSGRKEKYWSPVRTYTIITALLCVVMLLLVPSLLEWSILFLILTALGLYDPARKQRKTLTTRIITAITASLMLLVTYDVGMNFVRDTQFLSWLQHSITQHATSSPIISPHICLTGYGLALSFALLLCGYFVADIIFIRSLATHTHKRLASTTCIVTHCLCALGAWLGFYYCAVPFYTACMWILLIARCTVSLYVQHRFMTPQTSSHTQHTITTRSRHSLIYIVIADFLITIIYAFTLFI